MTRFLRAGRSLASLRTVRHLAVGIPGSLLIASLSLDAAYVLGGQPWLESWAYWVLSAGIVAELIEVIFGLCAAFGIRCFAPNRPMGLWQGTGNAFIATLFIWSWCLREADQPASTDAIVLSCLGASLVLLSIWLSSPVVVKSHSGAHEPF